MTAVDGATVGDALAIHDAVARAPVGSDLTYTLRRDADVFRVALPVRRFDRRDFATVFAPMLAVGAWTVAVGAALVVARPEVATLHAAFLVCLTLGLSLVTGPDQYGPYRFVSVFYLALALFPASVFHLSAAFLWWPSVWTRRLVAAVYAPVRGRRRRARRPALRADGVSAAPLPRVLRAREHDRALRRHR